jgi:alkylhydroperoxidase family enzyme
LYETSPLFSDAERAALQLSQSAASVPNQATQAHFDAAKAHFDEAQVAEIIAVVATFGFLNRWNDSLATDIEDNPLAFAETHLAATDWTPPRNK